MTALARRKTRLKFETASPVQNRPLIVQCHPQTLTIRQKYSRTKFTLSWQAVFSLAVKYSLAGRIE